MLPGFTWSTTTALLLIVFVRVKPNWCGLGLSTSTNIGQVLLPTRSAADTWYRTVNRHAPSDCLSIASASANIKPFNETPSTANK